MSETERPEAWPGSDPEGREVRFTHVDPRPRPDEYVPVLEGDRVRLEPLQIGHVDALCAAGSDPEIFRFTLGIGASRADMESFVREAAVSRDKGTAIPFVTVLRGHGLPDRIVGSTRFGNIDPKNRRMEIGSLNERSRRAILRIGAIQEGIFRSHVITRDGRIRNSVYFSIIAEDWPDVKLRLERLMKA
jgi:RimJ/RimL family protein N-acetyltransferase